MTTHHVCISSDLSCSGSNPCIPCKNLQREHVLTPALQAAQVTYAQADIIYAAWDAAWDALHDAMQADEVLAADALDLSRVEIHPVGFRRDVDAASAEPSSQVPQVPQAAPAAAQEPLAETSRDEYMAALAARAAELEQQRMAVEWEQKLERERQVVAHAAAARPASPPSPPYTPTLTGSAGVTVTDANGFEIHSAIPEIPQGSVTASTGPSMGPIGANGGSAVHTSTRARDRRVESLVAPMDEEDIAASAVSISIPTVDGGGDLDANGRANDAYRGDPLVPYVDSEETPPGVDETSPDSPPNEDPNEAPEEGRNGIDV